VSFYKNQAYYLFNTDFSLLFNYSLLNWIVIFCLILLSYLRWFNFLDLYTPFDRLYTFFFLLFFLFLFFTL
jgi:hypothetical protein